MSVYVTVSRTEPCVMCDDPCAQRAPPLYWCQLALASIEEFYSCMLNCTTVKLKAIENTIMLKIKCIYIQAQGITFTCIWVLLVDKISQV